MNYAAEKALFERVISEMHTELWLETYREETTQKIQACMER
jgi:hypothetical protein